MCAQSKTQKQRLSMSYKDYKKVRLGRQRLVDLGIALSDEFYANYAHGTFGVDEANKKIEDFIEFGEGSRLYRALSNFFVLE